MVTGDRDLRPGHLVHLLIDLATGEDTMSLTGSVRRVRDKNNGVSLAIAFPVLSADQEDAIHNAVLRALLRREAAVSGVDSLADAVRELEDEDTKYAGLVIHSVTHDARAMDVVEFFTRSESLRTIILPEPDGALCARAERLAKLSEVRVPRIWSRSELRRALSN